MKFNRTLSAFLAFLMVLSTLTVFSVATVFADTETGTTADTATEKAASASDETTEEAEEEAALLNTVNYFSSAYTSPKDKLADMQLMLSNDQYELYLQLVTGEVAYVDKTTGQALFSNPYDIALTSPSSSDDIKAQLMSQLIINYSLGSYNSYTECIIKNQMTIKYVNGGIRLEYAIGRLDARRLLPRQIERSRFETLILANFNKLSHGSIPYRRVTSHYILKDPFDKTLSTRSLKQMQSDFRITKKMAIYWYDATLSDAEKNVMEAFIKQYCPKYTLEMQEYDHDLTEYTGTEVAPPIFHAALEYYLEDDGLKVRCPVGGLRFVESDYQVSSLRVLPYFGCGAYKGVDKGEYSGYCFLPDGSGTIVRFEDFNDTLSRTITQPVYGQDCSYYTLSYEHQQKVRLPVFGVAASQNWTTNELQYDSNGNPLLDASGDTLSSSLSYKETKGFLGIIEDGAELIKLSSETGGALHNYDTVYTTLELKATDSYDISEAISAADSAMVATSSSMKYVGDYSLKYIMLNGDEEAAAAGLAKDDYYEASYVGMAKAYQDYLVNRGELTRLSDERVSDDIPLYLESFGTIETDDTFLSFPITVHTPLTTFDDMKTMYEEMKENGIKNVNWKMTGFFNGGLTSKAPKKAKVEKNVGGSDGLESFISYAKENGIELFPDFDFVFADGKKNNIFTGFNKRKYFSRATDGNRYAALREYSSVSQTYERTTYMVMSPMYYDYFFEKLTGKLDDYAFDSISVSTLGQYLGGNYDNDEDRESFLRDETLDYTVKLFAQLNEKYASVMTSSANSYALAYVTDVLNVPLDSSGFNYSSDTVPFMGMVLHGFVNFAGSAMNTIGDMQYEVLRSIENGASPYFILSFENTNVLKLDETYSKYYSIDYNIWKDDVFATYKTLNDALGDLQTQRIIDHEFLSGERVYSDAEWQTINGEIDNLATRFPVGTEEYNKALAVIQSKYVVDNNRMVKVTYENGATFYLNYNNYAVTVDDIELGAESFIRVEE